MRRLLIVIVVVLVAVVIAADRIGTVVGAHVLAGKIQTFEHLPHRPSASISGIPFLTQAFGGDYNDVKITAHEVPVSGVSVTTFTAHLHGVHLPFTKAVHGSVSQVPVDRVNGTAYVSFFDANAYLAKHPVAGLNVQLSPGSSGTTVNVIEQGRLAGRQLSLHGVGLVAVRSNVVTVTVSQLTSTGGTLPKGVSKQLKVSLPLRGLPFRLQLNAVRVGLIGMTATGGATNIVLGSRAH